MSSLLVEEILQQTAFQLQFDKNVKVLFNLIYIQNVQLIEHDNNPWPQYPKIYKLDSGQEEAASVFGHDPRSFATTALNLSVIKMAMYRS